LPVIGPASGCTVTIAYAVMQVVVYDTTAIPEETADTAPDELIVAMDVGEQLHTPPASEFLTVKPAPGHTGTLPVIVPGSG